MIQSHRQHLHDAMDQEDFILNPVYGMVYETEEQRRENRKKDINCYKVTFVGGARPKNRTPIYPTRTY